MDVPPNAVLEWDRGALAAECERAGVVRDGVEAYLGRSVFALDGELVVKVSLRRVDDEGGSRVEAQVSQRDADGQAWGERTVSGGEDCSSLDEPLTLVVALMVDRPSAPEAEEAAARGQQPVTEPPAPPALPDDAAAGEIETAPSLERALETPGHAVLLGFGAMALGMLPESGAGFGLAGSLKPRGFWGLGLEALVLLPQRKGVASGSLTSSLVAASASLCPLQGADTNVWWSACANLGVARLSAESRELLGARRVTEWLALPGFGARAAWRRDRLILGGGLAVAFPVSPDEYSYRDQRGERQALFGVNQVALTASLGAGVMLD